ncbi:hypothetical protein PWT90_03020 [Aphanocladium album]|nr:hypothetical protein PWT90_03020 [Aphanocladium album]
MTPVTGQPNRQYAVRGYSISHAADIPAWITLKIRLNGRHFSITVKESGFINSNNRKTEFCEHFSALDNEEEKKHIGTAAVNEFANWAMKPFLASFTDSAIDRLAVSKITLRDFYRGPSYECTLGAVDDCLDRVSIDYGAPASTMFLSVRLSDIEVVSDNPETILDDTPTVVRVGGIRYMYEDLDAASDKVSRQRIAVFEDLAAGYFGPDVRILRAAGIAQNKDQDIKGILFHPIRRVGPLDRVLMPGTAPEFRKRWIEQLEYTLSALHENRSVWGNAKPSNVVIDVHGDAWLVGFEKDYTGAWIAEGYAGTMTGDAMGMENIIHFINTGECP